MLSRRTEKHMSIIRTRHLGIKTAVAILTLALSVMMLSASAFAADDTNKCVQVKADGTEKSVEVGNVTVTNGQPGVDADALNEGKVNVKTGDIKSDGGNGISADATSLGTVTVNSGNIVSTGDNGIQAIIKDEGDITVTTGDISSGPHGSGIWTSIDSTSIVKGSTITIKSGDIDAQLEGIVIRPYSQGTISIEAGNVTAKDDGVQITSEDGGIAKLIASDITSEKSGMFIYVNEGSEIDALITGTLSGKKAPISFFASSWNMDERFKLTVWKILLNDGNVALMAEPNLEMQADAVSDESNQEITDNWIFSPFRMSEDGASFEKSILYIMKLIQPDEGAVLSATYADGSKLEERHGYSVAKEGEKVRFRVDLEDGYDLLAAYDGNDEEVELIKSDDGYYYIIYTVPKGGGLGLSVKLNAPFERMGIDALTDDSTEIIAAEGITPTVKTASLKVDDTKSSSSTTSSKPAQTGNDSSVQLLLAMVLLSCALLALIEAKRRHA